MMASQVVGYTDEWIKREIKTIKKMDRRYSESRIIDEALHEYVPRLKERLQPTQEPPRKSHS
jgi:hypothetical protein